MADRVAGNALPLIQVTPYGGSLLKCAGSAPYGDSLLKRAAADRRTRSGITSCSTSSTLPVLDLSPPFLDLSPPFFDISPPFLDPSTACPLALSPLETSILF